MRRFTADFETNVSEDDARVWAYSICEIGNIDNFIYGNNIADFINWCANKKQNYTLYFHNLKFDSEYIISYLLQNGFIRELRHQLISTADEVNEEIVDTLLREFNRRRQFDVNGKRFLIVQCGENNILKGTTGCAEFRLKDTQPEQYNRLEKLLNDVDIVLNPVHTRWGRFANFLTRIRKFSDNNRYCFSCTQMEGNQLQSARENPTHNTTHVAMYNQELITPIYTNEDENYLIQSYEIE